MIVYIIYFHAITVNLISYLKFNVTTFCFFRQAKDIGSEVTSQNSKYMITSRYQNVVQNENIAIGNVYFENVEKFKYLGVPGFDPGCRRGGDFSSVLRVWTGPGVHSTSYKMSRPTREFSRG